MSFVTQRTGRVKSELLWVTFFQFSSFTPGDNSPYTESPQDFLATEPEDIGQDIIFFTNPAQEEVSLSAVTAKGGEEVLQAQTANPVKQGFVKDQFPTPGYDKKLLVTVDFHQSVTLPSQHQEHLSTKDTWEPVEKASYPESYQPAPEENPDTDHDESHIQPTSSPETDDVSTTDGTTAEPSERHVSEYNQETESLDTPVVNATSGADANELLNSSSEAQQETDLPVSQEDHTPVADLEDASETELVHSSASYDVSGQPEEASAGNEEEMSVMTTSAHTEEPDVLSTTALPSFDNSTPENHPAEEESGEESANPDEETQNPVTYSLVAMETSSTSGLVPTADSSKYSKYYGRSIMVSQLFGLKAAADVLNWYWSVIQAIFEVSLHCWWPCVIFITHPSCNYDWETDFYNSFDTCMIGNIEIWMLSFMVVKPKFDRYNANATVSLHMWKPLLTYLQ